GSSLARPCECLRFLTPAVRNAPITGSEPPRIAGIAPGADVARVIGLGGWLVKQASEKRSGTSMGRPRGVPPAAAPRPGPAAFPPEPIVRATMICSGVCSGPAAQQPTAEDKAKRALGRRIP